MRQAQRRTGGTGLGLYALSKRLESLGGNCGVKDRADGASGSCFWVSIPFKPDETVEDVDGDLSRRSTMNTLPNIAHASEDLSPGRRDSASKMEVLMSGIINRADSNAESVARNSMSISSSRRRNRDGTHLRILLVDDSPLIRKATSRSLCKEGHHVEVAQHGAECLKMLAAADMTSETDSTSNLEYGFDLILMDLQMPVMDGIEATRRIRALEESETVAESGPKRAVQRHITIIGVTANSESEAREDCIDSGMDGFMEKPLKVHDLLDCISEINLEKKKMIFCDEV